MIKRGSKVRVVKMDTAGGMDWQAKRLSGFRRDRGQVVGATP